MANNPTNVQIGLSYPAQPPQYPQQPQYAMPVQGYPPNQMASAPYPVGQPVYTNQPPPPQMAMPIQPQMGQNPEIHGNTISVETRNMPMANHPTYPHQQQPVQQQIIIANIQGQRRCPHCGETSTYIKGDPSPVGWVLCIITCLFVGCLGLLCLCIFTEQRYYCTRCNADLGAD